jgi:hypothetical protein
MKVKSPNNISKWHMEFNSAFKGLTGWFPNWDEAIRFVLSLPSDSLRPGRSGDPIPVAERIFAPVQTDPGAHPASCTKSTAFVSRRQSGRGVALIIHRLLAKHLMKEYSYTCTHPLGLHGMFYGKLYLLPLVSGLFSMSVIFLYGDNEGCRLLPTRWCHTKVHDVTSHKTVILIAPQVCIAWQVHNSAGIQTGSVVVLSVYYCVFQRQVYEPLRWDFRI